jgi:transcriptional regulator with XRE-family HTH domain
MAKKKREKPDRGTTHPLTRWRFRNGRMSLAELGRRVKASAPHLSDIENGVKNPSIELAERLTKETQLSVRQIAPNLLRTLTALDRLQEIARA